VSKPKGLIKVANTPETPAVAPVTPEEVKPVMTPEQAEARIKELTGYIAANALTDPVGVQNALVDLRKLMKSQESVIEQKAQATRAQHEGSIKAILQDAFDQIAGYSRDNSLPAYIASFRVGFVQTEGTPANGVGFDWAGRSEKKTRKASGGGRKRAGTLYDESGKAVGSYDSAAAACRALGLEIPMSAKTGKPARNASLVLSDNKYTWKPA
jgi:hypothetical protein